MVNQTNQTNQNTTHICKWGGCTDKFDSMLLLWKHVEQHHVDNASPRLIHLVNDDDEVTVTSPQNRQNTTTTKSSINFVANSQINQPHHPTFGTIVNGVGNIHNGQRMQNLSPQQGYMPYDVYHLSQKPHQYVPLPNYHLISTQPQFQPTVRPLLIHQPHIIQPAGQTSMIPSLGSMPNPIPIDDSITMDVDPPVNHQRLGRPPLNQEQKKVVNLNRQSLSQNINK